MSVPVSAFMSSAHLHPRVHRTASRRGELGSWLLGSHRLRVQKTKHCSSSEEKWMESKVLRTVPLLAACLPQDKCKVKIGRRFSEERDTELSTVCRKPGTLILYPGAEATNLEDFLLDSPVYPSTLILIDGTWSQAKDIFYKNSLFRLPKQVQLKTSLSSQYVIRMQPANRCLSTLECAAVALSILEKNSGIQETLLRPLQALCSFQLQHGAQIRLSKEHLLRNGLYPKPMPQSKRKLRKMELLMNTVKI
ncbi:tRNA-uridine aminocarboxypropyltransferase 2 isoform X3 [Castor canadensis]|uniref:tRNA-uridine aminocarboxypropyltransferase 2 isoform X3 n=1 Tax=Castor canadensis TaxID=51338 RepID=A0AC58L7I3_CASCN